MKQPKSPEQLHEDLQLMRQLRTPIGFYKYFFSLLPKFTTRIDAFNAANDKHLEFFGEYRYASYKSFASCRFKINQRKKKK